jgi:hypothetical protein
MAKLLLSDETAITSCISQVSGAYASYTDDVQPLSRGSLQQ